MKRVIAIGLLAGMLFQFLAALTILVRFELDRERIAAVFCVNKDKPELKCEGTCHLNKQLNEQSGSSDEVPAELSEWNFVFFGMKAGEGTNLPIPLSNAHQFNNAGIFFPFSGAISDIFHPPRVQYT